MESISFKLEVFEGPLDLLLSLISKHKLNICDIEISKLLEQYLLYIDQAHEQNFELAGEFLEMARSSGGSVINCRSASITACLLSSYVTALEKSPKTGAFSRPDMADKSPRL